MKVPPASANRSKIRRASSGSAPAPQPVPKFAGAERVLGDAQSGPVPEGRVTHEMSLHEGWEGGRAGVEG